jgi:hypothetical protein
MSLADTPSNAKTAGTVISIRRPGPPFAFVEYGDPESVLRCLEVINGVTLSWNGGPEKALAIKADEKTRARLDEYEKTRVESDVSCCLLPPSPSHASQRC